MKDSINTQTIESATTLTYTTENGQINFNTTSTSTFIVNTTKEIKSTRFIENESGNIIEVISEITSPYMNSIYFNNNKSMLKEIYGAVDGKIQLIQSITGKLKEGYYVPPTVDWNE